MGVLLYIYSLRKRNLYGYNTHDYAIESPSLHTEKLICIIIVGNIHVHKEKKEEFYDFSNDISIGIMAIATL